jgi:hydrogenase nickel incorporation protein HypA/HybF
MHELSIALSMIEQVEQQAAPYPGAVRSIQVKIGALSGVDVEALRFAWEMARAGTPLAETQLEIEPIPLRVRCPQCGQTRTPEIQSIACPDCIAAEQEILAGKELELTSMEVDA